MKGCKRGGLKGITPGEEGKSCVEGSRMLIILLRTINQDFGQTWGVQDKMHTTIFSHQGIL